EALDIPAVVSGETPERAVEATELRMVGPGRVVLEDQLLRGFADRARQWQPVIPECNEFPAVTQDALYLACRLLMLEPVPAGGCGDNVETGIGKECLLRAGNDVIHAHARFAVQPVGLLDQFMRDIEPGHIRAAPRQLTREQAGATAEIEDLLAAATD